MTLALRLFTAIQCQRPRTIKLLMQKCHFSVTKLGSN